MNYKNLFIPFLIVFSFFSCSEGPNYFEPAPIFGPYIKNGGWDYDGSFIRHKNGNPFEGNVYYINHEDICHGCFSFGIHTYEDSLELREQFIIGNLNWFKSEYELFPGSSTPNGNFGYDKKTQCIYDTFLSDGDVGGDVYTLNTGAPNWVKLESIDTINGILKGSLQAHFEKTLDNDPRNPKYIRISDGEFELHID